MSFTNLQEYLDQQSTSSNVISLQNSKNLANATRKSEVDLFFPVDLVPLESVAPGFDGLGQQAVVRRDTNQILKVHGARYNLIRNREVFGSIDDMIRHSGDLDTNGMIVEDQVAYDGGRSMRTYIFPEHQVKVDSGLAEQQVGDITQLRMTILNSYNGDTNLRINIGGFRLVCLNGMVVGESFGTFRSQHTAGYRPDEVAPRIAASLDNFLKLGSRWKIWSQTPCTPEMAKVIIDKVAGKSVQLNNSLTTFWANESLKMGATLWSLYNALTFWSTHYDIASRSQGNSSAIIQEREQRVSRVLQHRIFMEAA